MAAVSACTACATESPSGARFCMQCGAPLARGCTNCGAALPDGARYCPSCGASLTAASATPATSRPPPERTPRTYTPNHLADKILASRAALEGERKQVTVLFADVKGSLELAEQAGAEEWHAILDRFFAILTDGVHRFEGTVNQYTGDGIMALFGAPLAHEDHAQRACYAALHLRDALRGLAQELRRERGLDFATRIGLNSGEVVVGKIGDDLRMDYTAQGHTVGLAQRMEALAEAGRIYLSAATAQLALGYFVLADLGEFRVKGASEPVRVHELSGVGALRTRFDVSRARGLSKLVGRDDDLAALDAALRLARGGQGRVVGVVAEAGTGKSRLCFELAERCRAQGIAVYEGRCLAHGRMIPFVPIRELLRALFGIAESDDSPAVRRKIAGTMLLADRELESELALVFDFLGAPDPQRPAPRVDPEAGAHQLGRIVRQLVKDASARAPCMVLVEDLHWIDAASDALLAQLAESAAGSQALLVTNFRPEYRAPWMQRSHYQQLALAPLGPEATAALLRGSLGADPSTAALAGEIHAHTGGNPFFVEEVVQALVEEGRLTGARGAYRYARGNGLGVPARVQDLLAARIDRLPEREKQLLGIAAVIGRELPEALLLAVAELPERELRESAARLVAAELLVEASLYPRLAYAFKHPLTREVAYQAQLATRRAKQHAAVARALMAHEQEHLDEAAAEIAHHFEQAGEALEAARWHARAARVAGRNAPADAKHHWARTLALVERMPEAGEVGALVVEAGLKSLIASTIADVGAGPVSSERSALYERCAGIAARAGDARSLALLHATMAWEHGGYRADREAFARTAAEAERVANESGDLALVAAISARLSIGHLLLGGAAAAIPFIERVLARIPHDPGFGRGYIEESPYERLLNHYGMALSDAGRSREAQPHLRRSLEIAQQNGDLWAQITAHLSLTWNAVEAEDGAALRAHALAASQLADKIGSTRWWHSTRLNMSRALLERGEFHEALAAAEEGIRLAGAGAGLLLHRACALAALGETAVAREDLGRCGEISFNTGGILLYARAWRLVDGAAAREPIERNLAVAHQRILARGERGFLPQLHGERAELALLLGDRAGFARELREARRLYAEMALPRQVDRVERRHVEVLGTAEEERGA